jgi:hypothetical protein
MTFECGAAAGTAGRPATSDRAIAKRSAHANPGVVDAVKGNSPAPSRGHLVHRVESAWQPRTTQRLWSAQWLPEEEKHLHQHLCLNQIICVLSIKIKNIFHNFIFYNY